MEAVIERAELTNEQKKFRDKMLNSWLFRFFAFFNVPAGWIAGMKLTALDCDHCTTTLPFKFLNKNPFKSIYFAVQSMAAELSTASLVLLNLEGRKPSVAYIITDMDATFPKKATDRVWYTCEGGEEVQRTVEECISSGEPRTVKLKTVGRMKDGTEVATFHFTWSMKQRSK